MRQSIKIPICAILGPALGLTGTAAYAASPGSIDRPLEVIAIPPNIELGIGPEDAQLVTIVARPRTNCNIRFGGISVVPAPGLGADIIDKPPSGNLPTSTDFSWAVRIFARSDISPGTAPAAQMVRVEYHILGCTTGPQNDRSVVEIVPIGIKTRAIEPASTFVEADILKDFDSLFDVQGGSAYLRIQNKGNSSVKVTSLQFISQNFLVVHPNEGTHLPVEVPPHGVTVEELGLNFPDNPKFPFRSGSYSLIAIVSLERDTGVERWTGQVLAETKVAIGVPGLSEVQTLVQVPSFLMLPGALVLAAAGLVQRLFKRPTDNGSDGKTSGESMLKPSSPNFWVVSITISILIVAAYPFVTTFFGHPRNILIGYGLRDVVYVWLGSVIVGALVSLVISAIARSLRRRVTITRHDQPIVFLRRLAHLHSSILWPSLKMMDATGSAHYLFPLGLAAPGEQKEWAVPTIMVTAKDVSRSGTLLAELQTKIDSGDTWQVHKALSQALASGAVNAEWDKWGNATGPTPIDPSSIGGVPSDKRPIVELN